MVLYSIDDAGTGKVPVLMCVEALCRKSMEGLNMTTRKDYAEGEWALIRQAPVACADCVMYADMNVADALKETDVVANLVASWKEPGKTANTLIQDVMADIDVSPTRKSGNQSPEEILEDVRAVVAAVGSKAPADEAQEFRQFLYEWARTVAHASGEGFQGTGEKLSDKEAATLDNMKTVLGV